MAYVKAPTNWQQYNPSGAWIGQQLDEKSLVPAGGLLDPAQFIADDGAVVVVTAAGAIEGAVAIPVVALANPIPNGTVLDFGGAKFARLTAAADAGDESLTVAALPTALVEDDTATYVGTSAGIKRVLSGTLVGRTFAERDAGTRYGVADVATDEDIYLLAMDVPDLNDDDECQLYRHGCLVKENLLPNFAGLTAGEKAWIRANYEVTRGLE